MRPSLFFGWSEYPEPRLSDRRHPHALDLIVHQNLSRQTEGDHGETQIRSAQAIDDRRHVARSAEPRLVLST
jgi:hypothetical protein